MAVALIPLKVKPPLLTPKEQTLYPLESLRLQEQELPSAEQVQLRPTMVQFPQVVLRVRWLPTLRSQVAQA